MIHWYKYFEKLHTITIRCRVCQKDFNTFAEFKKHYLNNHDIDITFFTCKHCNKVFIEDIPNQKVCGKPKCLLKEN